MAWRPRKSFTFGKGFRINLSRRGVGWSVGIPKLFRIGIGSDRRLRSSFGSGLFRHEFHHGKVSEGQGGRRSGCGGCLVLFLVAALALVFFENFSGGTGSVPEREPYATVARGAPNSRKSEKSANPVEKGGLRVNTKPRQRPAAAPVPASGEGRSAAPAPPDVKATANGGEEGRGDSVAIRIPTGVRIWRSSDGRTLEGRITAIQPASDTITLERADGQIFRGVPISRLHPEDAASLRTSNPR